MIVSGLLVVVRWLFSMLLRVVRIVLCFGCGGWCGWILVKVGVS